MNNINIFCFTGQDGCGKTDFINDIMKDKKFIAKGNIERLIYHTTRAKKENEVDGVDYYFSSKNDYNLVPKEKMMEFRSYYTIPEGTIYYYTILDDIKDKHNLLCVCSPYQYESYRNWASINNIKNNDCKVNLFNIYIDTSMKLRVERRLEKVDKDEQILEICRRTIQDNTEYKDVSKRLAEMCNPELCNNTCIVNNDNLDDYEKNLNKIKDFIRMSISDPH